MFLFGLWTASIHCAREREREREARRGEVYEELNNSQRGGRVKRVGEEFPTANNNCGSCVFCLELLSRTFVSNFCFALVSCIMLWGVGVLCCAVLVSYVVVNWFG